MKTSGCTPLKIYTADGGIYPAVCYSVMDALDTSDTCFALFIFIPYLLSA